MNITAASLLIDAAYQAGTISLEVSRAAHIAIRERSYYGSRMSADDRRRMLALRFGIVEA